MNGSSSWWIVAGVFWSCAAFFFVGGYLIRVHGKLRHLAGYRPELVMDKEGLARHAGTMFWWIGIATLAVPVVLLAFPGDAAVVVGGVGYSALVMFWVLVLAVTSRRYMR